MKARTEEMGLELREARQENIMLQKQLRSQERQIEDLETALERERRSVMEEQRNVSETRALHEEEKMKNRRIVEELERQADNVSVIVY